MPLFLVAIQFPAGYDPVAAEDESMARDIDALNDEMVAAGVRVFAGGLQPPATGAKSLRRNDDGEIVVRDGPYLESKEFVGGFWILDTASMDEAVAWGRKAVVACRVPAEVREFISAP